MSSFATGGGYAVIKKDKEKELNEFLETFSNEYVELECYRDTDGAPKLDIVYEYSDWKGSLFQDILTEIAPFIQEGDVAIQSENGDMWKYWYDAERGMWFKGSFKQLIEENKYFKTALQKAISYMTEHGESRDTIFEEILNLPIDCRRDF